MKKKLIIVILILSLLITSCQKTDFNQLKLDFDSLLASGSYDQANALYLSAEGETIDYYNQSLTEYSTNLIYSAQNNADTEQAKADLNAFIIFDYTRANIQQTLDEIVANEQAMQLSKTSYIEGIDLFLVRDYDAAYQKLSLVESSDINYQNAIDTMAAIDARNVMWTDAQNNNAMGRNPSVNSLAYKDGYVYFPIDNNNIHSIVKHNYATGETILFPLIEYKGIFHIEGINVIGDYIYFIAGEELGTGAMLDTPYNIYEMKTDGTELTMVKSGDYFDLVLQGSTFYALSHSKGLVKMDKNFANEEVISDKWIIEMQVTNNGVYYTEKTEDEYDAEHVLYNYKDGVSTEIMREELLHAYFFDTYSIYYHDMKENYREEIYAADLNLANAQRIAILKDGSIGDMYNLIGALGDRILLNTAGWVSASTGGAPMRQRIYAELTMSDKRINTYHSMKVAPQYEVTKVLYEEGAEFIEHADGTYSFSTSPSNNINEHVISIPSYDVMALDINMSILSEGRPGDEDFYSADEVVVELDNFWYYSSPTLNVTIEKMYSESLENMIFVANIRTKDLSGFNIGYGNLQAPGNYNEHLKTDDIAKLNNAVFATNGDFAMHAKNQWSGKVIRNGKIYDAILDKGIIEFEVDKVYDSGVNCDDFLVMYPNGEMVAYTEHDGITYGQLLEAGVENFLSFGPILVRDDDKTSACTDPTYYISGPNPRCAWGMVEPGHYVAVVADGRQSGVSRGLSFYSLSEYFQDLGCSVAYNLDGGQTAAMSFMGRFLNTHQHDMDGKKWVNHRYVWEVISFGTSDLVPYDLENYYEE